MTLPAPIAAGLSPLWTEVVKVLAEIDVSVQAAPQPVPPGRASASDNGGHDE